MAPNNSSVTENGRSEMTKSETTDENNEVSKDAQIKSSNCEASSIKLGKYSDAFVPMAFLITSFAWDVISCWNQTPDPRTKDWFLMGNSGLMFLVSTLYVIFSTVWGPRLMANREPYTLKTILIIYNSFQVILSAWMFYEFGMSGWFFHYSYKCQLCDYSKHYRAVRMSIVSWVFFMSKLLDFCDTLFFVARKKYNQISVLHLVHHSCMVVTMWYGVKYVPGGHLTSMGFLNSAVHTIMYVYYLLSAMGPSVKPFLWWKKYLTTIQLVQFVVVLIHSIQVLFRPSCIMPMGLLYQSIMYSITFFGLFINFYKKSYRKKEKNLTQKNSLTVQFPPSSIMEHLPETKSTSSLLKNHLNHRSASTVISSTINSS